MNGINLNAFEDSEVDIDLRRCPAGQIGPLLDLVRFDRFLDYVYTVLLKREPDREGQVHYRTLAGRGMTRPDVVRQLLRSREYRLSSLDGGRLAVDEFVNRAYQDILGRWPDQDGLDTYRRIASRPNGRKKVLANLQASGEAVRKNGGRLARIEVLRRYARTGWRFRLPGVGRWFSRRRTFHQRLDRIALRQHLLAQQVASLREEVEAASLTGTEPFGFAAETHGDRRFDAIFQDALIRARREA